MKAVFATYLVISLISLVFVLLVVPEMPSSLSEEPCLPSEGANDRK